MSRATEGFSARTAIALESPGFIGDFSMPSENAGNNEMPPAPVVRWFMAYLSTCSP
jgi:hypothetical protein